MSQRILSNHVWQHSIEAIDLRWSVLILKNDSASPTSEGKFHNAVNLSPGGSLLERCASVLLKHEARRWTVGYKGKRHVNSRHHRRCLLAHERLYAGPPQVFQCIQSAGSIAA